MPIHAKWTEVAFALSAIGALTLPPVTYPYLAALTAVPTIAALRRAFNEELKKMQRSVFGWYVNNMYGVYGTNEWISSLDGKLFRPAEGYLPAPAFNYRGLLSVAASIPEIELIEANDKKNINLDGNLLLVGGTRVTPLLKTFLDDQKNVPFQFVEEKNIKKKYLPPSPPASFVRHFNDNGVVYKRESITGKYLVDTRDPDRPPIGPFVSENGRITGDVLVLTIGMDASGKKITVANAGYGAADRISDVLCDGYYIEKMLSNIPTIGPTQIQVVFAVPVEHTDKGELYNRPELIDLTIY